MANWKTEFDYAYDAIDDIIGKNSVAYLKVLKFKEDHPNDGAQILKGNLEQLLREIYPNPDLQSTDYRNIRIFWFHYRDQMTYVDIADVVNLSRTRVGDIFRKTVQIMRSRAYGNVELLSDNYDISAIKAKQQVEIDRLLSEVDRELYINRVFHDHTRVATALSRAGFKTLYNVFDAGYRIISSVRGIGDESLKVIHQALRLHGFNVHDFIMRGIPSNEEDDYEA
ncbi:MAG: hypothetical protein NC489_08435 [Ruminococcus flavefaciens]|nr:hypothetical protein [Ruminococcus flavefaciens]